MARPPDWITFEATLAGVLLRLQHREHVLVDSRRDDNRYLQALRSGPVLTVECSGPSADGGCAQLTTRTQLALLDLGWPPVEPEEYPNYRTYWMSKNASDLGWQDHTGAREAAALMCASLRTLGVLDPDDAALARETFIGPNPQAMPSAADLAEVSQAITDRQRRQGGYQ